MVAAGKPFPLNQGVAVADRDEVKVILCDGPVPVGSVKDDFDRRDLAKAGKVHCLENNISSAGRVTGSTVLVNVFKMFPSAGSTWMVFDPSGKTAGRISGRIHTTQEHKSFDDIPYSWDVTFDLPVTKPKP